MSFRRFIYYGTLVGAWAAFIAWVLARVLAPSNPFWAAVVYGLFLGLTVAFGLSLVDALWNISARQFLPIFVRVAAAMIIGLGSAVCSGIAGGLYGETSWQSMFLIGWIGLGFLVGVSVSLFDMVAGFARGDIRGPAAKLLKCTLGGTFGGILGGILVLVLRFLSGWLLNDAQGERLWTPTAIGFVTLGGLIGLLVGLSQVILLEAWVRIEAGFRPGRDLILSRDRIVIGRAEGSDIALFGDSGVEKHHALIVLDHGVYFLEPLPSTAGTYINDQPISVRTRLVAGDLIRIGKSLLRFNQRRKR
jgi:hypothetical protein